MKKVLLVLAAILAAAFIFLVVLPAFSGVIQITSLFKFGDIEIRLYGLVMAVSILLGYFIARHFAPRFGIDKNEADNFTFWLVVVSILGARLYYVLFALSYYSERPTESIQIWQGGLSIYGALITGLIFSYFWTRKKTYSVRQLLDLLGISLPLAQALGRWGNFFNQEAFGYPTDLPWKMYVSPEYRPLIFSESEYFHPTFLYESLYMVVVFFVLRALIGKVKPGVLGMSYLALYALGRFFIEPLRLDSVWLSNFRADQVVSLIIILLVGVVILRWEFLLGHKDQQNN